MAGTGSRKMGNAKAPSPNRHSTNKRIGVGPKNNTSAKTVKPGVKSATSAKTVPAGRTPNQRATDKVIAKLNKLADARDATKKALADEQKRGRGSMAMGAGITMNNLRKYPKGGNI